MTHASRGRRDAHKDIATYGLAHAVRVAGGFTFEEQDLYDGGFSYASGYLAVIADFGGPR